MNERSRADLHVHSTASELSKLGVQRSLQLPECATAPEEVYELAKRRGMDYVTITDHDTIAGALALDQLPDVFISEELTAWFKGEPQAVHILCYGITADDHDWLQGHHDDVEECAQYLAAHEITAALAHPFYAVEAPLTPRHRRRLAQLFPVWETRNGARAKELNLPAYVYIETHGGTAIGGSDDHAGIDVGRTFTETPPARTAAEFLEHIRAGRAQSRGAQGGAAKWAHAAMALAIRALGSGDDEARPDPAAVWKIVQRVVREGDVRRGGTTGDLSAADARALLRAWLQAMELELPERELIQLLQDGELDHPDLYRRARRIHERKLARSIGQSAALTTAQAGGAELAAAAGGLFEAAIPAIPYAAATIFLGREKAKLTRGDAEPARVALITDGLSSMHGVTNTVTQIRERGVPGFEVEVIGTDPEVDRRLSAVLELELPYYEGLTLGVPSVPAIVEALAEGDYELVHICAPGPAGIAAILLARVLELPVVGSYHTELDAYVGVRTGRPELEAIATLGLGAFYGACELVLSPSPAGDERLGRLGLEPGRIARWGRGVDLRRFDPALRTPGLLPGEINVMYAGRLSTEKGIELLAEAFLEAQRRDPRLHLVLAGGGPEEEALRARLGAAGTFLGWLSGEELARAYASADVFLFASRTDTFGQVVLEAQASGLPVIAVDEGGPAALIEHGTTGMLTAARAEEMADALVGLVATPMLRERIVHAALNAVQSRTWDAALHQLAGGYRIAREHRAVAGRLEVA